MTVGEGFVDALRYLLPSVQADDKLMLWLSSAWYHWYQSHCFSPVTEQPWRRWSEKLWVVKVSLPDYVVPFCLFRYEMQIFVVVLKAGDFA